MATRFELVLCGEDAVRLRSAGEEALAEIERLDGQLSFYDPRSEISWLNANAAKGPVKVEPRLFELLRLAVDLNVRTDGAFDIAVAPLMRAWGFTTGSGSVPSEDLLRDARETAGARHLRLDEANRAVEFDREGVAVDLGGIGKGYAIDCAVEILRESGVTSALLHGGTSTVHAIGSPPRAEAWQIAVRTSLPSTAQHSAPSTQRLPSAALRDCSLSVSAVHGKAFTDGAVEYGHVIDPRTGRPAGHSRLAAVTGPSATICDALSTALLVLGEPWLPLLADRFPGYAGSTL